MSIVAILAALLIEQWRPLGDRRQVQGALAAWAGWLERSFNAGEQRHGMIAWLVAVLPADPGFPPATLLRDLRTEVGIAGVYAVHLGKGFNAGADPQVMPHYALVNLTGAVKRSYGSDTAATTKAMSSTPTNAMLAARPLVFAPTYVGSFMMTRKGDSEMGRKSAMIVDA